MSFDKEQFLLDRIEQLTQRGAELTAQRDAALAELAALKKRIADAPQTIAHVHRDGSMHGCFGQGGPDFGVCMVAIVRLTEEDV